MVLSCARLKLHGPKMNVSRWFHMSRRLTYRVMTLCRLAHRFRAYVEAENISIPDGSRTKRAVAKKNPEMKYRIIVGYRGRFQRS